MCHKLDDDELGSDTASWPQEMLSGYSYFTWLHATCCVRVVASLTYKATGEVTRYLISVAVVVAIAGDGCNIMSPTIKGVMSDLNPLACSRQCRGGREPAGQA